MNQLSKMSKVSMTQLKVMKNEMQAAKKLKVCISVKILFCFILTQLFSTFFSCCLYAQSENGKNEQNWKFSFDQPQTVWRVETAEPHLKTIEHKYSPQEGYGKRGCEYISLQIPAQAKSVMLGMKVGTGRLTDDVLPTIYIKSNKTGLRFMLRIILPMTQEESRPGNRDNSGSSGPMAILLAGGTYSLNGSWQQIRIDRPLDLLKEQAQDISRKRGQNVDITNAYYDMAYLDINAGEGELNLWIDDLEITGYAPISPGDYVKGSLGNPPKENKRIESPAPGSVNNAIAAPDVSPSDINPDAQDSSAAMQTPQVRVGGASIFVNDSLFFIRAIRYRGESFEYLRQLGFNTLWMDSVPTDGQMIQAQEQGLWIICPPPLTKQQWDVFTEEAARDYTPTFWGDKYYRVIAWNLGNLSQNSVSVEQTKLLCHRIHECDREVVRPIIAQADESLRDYSRQVDSLIIDRNPIYSSLDLIKYLRWHRDIPCLIQPGMPRICVVQTQPDAKLVQSWKAMFSGETFPESIPYEQLQLTSFAAAGSGVRGLFFDSQTPLDSNNPDAQYRSRSLELLNSRLFVADSFFAAGTQSTPVKTSDDHLWFIMLTIPQKGRLALPLYMPDYAQYSLAGRYSRSVTANMPNIPSTYNAYRLTPNGLEPLSVVRKAGRTDVTLESQVDWSMILMAQNSSVISSLYNRLRTYGKQSSVLFRDITANRLENFRPWFNPNKASKEEIDLFNRATEAINRSEWMISQNLWSESDKSICDAANALRILEFSYWTGIVGSRREPNFHPAAVSFRTMRLYHAWQQNMQNYKQGDNLLPAGDFESLDEFMDANWALYLADDASSQVTAKGDINPMAAFSGKSGLRLTAQTPPGLQNVIALLDKSPVTILSPTVQVEPFETVKISCLVNLPQPLKCTVDGLKITDVQSGDVLARRVTKTLGWQPIVMFRTADSEGKVQLCFELTGVGTAYVDNVKIIRIVPGSDGEKVE